MAGWLVDTSAWSRRQDAGVAQELAALAAEPGGLWLSPPVLLELLREPQGDSVAGERATLLKLMKVASVNNETFRLAADAMERLAQHGPEGHRLPVTDLVTAAIAHQLDMGVAHCDGDYELLANHSGFTFKQHKIDVPVPVGGHPATKQRALRKELAQILHHVPAPEAEAFLEKIVHDARKLYYS